MIDTMFLFKNRTAGMNAAMSDDIREKTTTVIKIAHGNLKTDTALLNKAFWEVIIQATKEPTNIPITPAVSTMTVDSMRNTTPILQRVNPTHLSTANSFACDIMLPIIVVIKLNKLRLNTIVVRATKIKFIIDVVDANRF